MTEYTECTNCGGWCCGKIKKIAFKYLDRWLIAQEFGMSILEVTEQFATRQNGTKKIRTRATSLNSWVRAAFGHKVGVESTI